MELDVLLHFNKGVTTLRVTEVSDRPRSQSEVNVHTMRCHGIGTIEKIYQWGIDLCRCLQSRLRNPVLLKFHNNVLIKKQLTCVQ